MAGQPWGQVDRAQQGLAGQEPDAGGAGQELGDALVGVLLVLYGGAQPGVRQRPGEGGRPKGDAFPQAVEHRLGEGVGANKAGHALGPLGEDLVGVLGGGGHDREDLGDEGVGHAGVE